MASTLPILSLELPGGQHQEPQDIQAIDMDADSANGKSGRWTQEEHKLFLQGLERHQKQWKLIADLVKTRTVVQIRTHAQKYFQKLQKKAGKDGGKTGSMSLSLDEADLYSNSGRGMMLAPFSVDSRSGSGVTSVDGAVTSSEGESDVERQQQRHSQQQQFFQQQQLLMGAKAQRVGAKDLSHGYDNNGRPRAATMSGTGPSINPLSAHAVPVVDMPSGVAMAGSLGSGGDALMLKLAAGGSNSNLVGVAAMSAGNSTGNGTKSGGRSRHGTPRTKASKNGANDKYGLSAAAAASGSGSQGTPSAARKRTRGEAKHGVDSSSGNNASYAGSKTGGLSGLRSPKKKSNTNPNSPMGSPVNSFIRHGSAGNLGLHGANSQAAGRIDIKDNSSGGGSSLTLQQQHHLLLMGQPNVGSGAIVGSDLLFPCIDHATAGANTHTELSELGMHGHADQLLDPNIIDLLDKIDWWHSDSHSGGPQSRSASPFTDTASSISSSCASSAYDLHQAFLAGQGAANPNPPAANNNNAVTSTQHQQQRQSSFIAVGSDSGSGSTSVEGIALNTITPLGSTLIDGERSSKHTAAGIDSDNGSADGVREPSALEGATTETSDDAPGGNCTSNTQATSQSRSAFSSVIDELKFVTKVARSSAHDPDQDHISLYNLFQKPDDDDDSSSSTTAVRRLPSMRTLARTLAESQLQQQQSAAAQYSAVAVAAATAARCRLGSVGSQMSLDAEFSKFMLEDCGFMRDSVSSTGSDQQSASSATAAAGGGAGAGIASSDDIPSHLTISPITTAAAAHDLNVDGSIKAAASEDGDDSESDSPQRRSLTAGVGSEPLLMQNPNQLSMLHPMTSMPICHEAAEEAAAAAAAANGGKGSKTPASPPRKRGRPRKYPLPVHPAATALAASGAVSTRASAAAAAVGCGGRSSSDGDSVIAGWATHSGMNDSSQQYQHDPALSHEMHIPAIAAFQQAVAEQQQQQQFHHQYQEQQIWMHQQQPTFQHYGHTEHDHTGSATGLPHHGNGEHHNIDLGIIDPFDSFDSGMLEVFE